MELFHSVPLAGHLAKDKTTHKIKRYFHWPGVDEDVAKYCDSCKDCKLGKYRTHKRGAAHIPYDVPDYPWQVVHMDYKTGLPLTRRNKDAFVIFVCKLTKRLRAVPCRKDITATQTADIMFREVVRNHGIPEVIISDRDPKFTSSFWQTLWRTIFTRLNMSTARHPATDSQAERAIRTMVEMLRVFCHENPHEWDMTLGALEFAYNDSLHPAT